MMFSFIPHTNNVHSWRTFLFTFFVLIISAGGAYLAAAYPEILQKETVFKRTVSIDNPILQPSEAPIPAVQEPKSAASVASANQPVEGGTETPAVIETVEKTPLPKIDRNKNPATRLEEAKIYTQPQIITGKYIDISLQFQNMVIFEDGVALDAYVVSSGKKGLDTPVGTFKVENKSPRAWSKGYGLWMPNWMAIIPSGKVGIHELPIWPGGFQEGASHLGTPVSHGCVRLGSLAAKRVYDWAEIGTPVIIHK